MQTVSFRQAFSLALIILCTTVPLSGQLFATAAADPEPTIYYQLRGVLIEMKDGQTHIGYVHWAAWDFDEESAARFPQALIDPAVYGGSMPDLLELLTEVHQAAAPIAESLELPKLLVTDAAEWRKLPTEQIARITARPLPHDGDDANLVFFGFAPSSIKLLAQATPRATLLSAHMGSLLVSYNEQIGPHELAQLGEQFAKLLNEQASRSKQALVAARAKAKHQLEQYLIVVIDLPSGC